MFCSKKCRLHTIKTKQKIGKANSAHKNGMWKGKDAGLQALHIWVSRRKKKPKFCNRCKKQPPRDLANISQKYYRSLNDFEWLCRKCHMRSDGRLERLIKRNKKIQ
jgi:hypothetical protein